MKYLIPLILPFLIMVVVNEYSRPGLTGFHNAKYNATGMNPNVPMKDKCTWTGFFDTGYCKQHHVKYMSSLYEYIDPIYFGIISLLHATGKRGERVHICYSVAASDNYFVWVLLLLKVEGSQNKRMILSGTFTQFH